MKMYNDLLCVCFLSFVSSSFAASTIETSTVPPAWEDDYDSAEISVTDYEKVKVLVRQQVNKELVNIERLQEAIYKNFHTFNGACLAASSGKNYFDVDTKRCESCASCWEEGAICLSYCSAYMNTSYSQNTGNPLHQKLFIIWISVSLILVFAIAVICLRTLMLRRKIQQMKMKKTKL